MTFCEAFELSVSFLICNLVKIPTVCRRSDRSMLDEKLLALSLFLRQFFPMTTRRSVPTFNFYSFSFNFSTPGHEVICSYSGPTSIYSISADEKSVYWSDWRQQAVLKVDLMSSSVDSECRPQVVRKLHTRFGH